MLMDLSSFKGTVVDFPSRLRWQKVRGGGRYVGAPWVYLPGNDARHRFKAIRTRGRRGTGRRSMSWFLVVADPVNENQPGYEVPITIPVESLKSAQQAAYTLLQRGDVGFAP